MSLSRYEIVALVMLIAASSARAEEKDFAVGVEGSALMLSLGREAVEDATWTAGVTLSYGLLDDLTITGELLLSTHDVYGGRYRVAEHGYSHTGRLSASHAFFAMRAGLRYKLLAGYLVAPHLEAGVGFLHSEFWDASLYGDDGDRIGVTVGDFSQDGLILRAGLVLDYSIFEFLYVGLGVYMNWVLGDHLVEHMIEIPFTVQYYFYL